MAAPTALCTSAQGIRSACITDRSVWPRSHAKTRLLVASRLCQNHDLGAGWCGVVWCRPEWSVTVAAAPLPWCVLWVVWVVWVWGGSVGMWGGSSSGTLVLDGGFSFHPHAGVYISRACLCTCLHTCIFWKSRHVQTVYVERQRERNTL